MILERMWGKIYTQYSSNFGTATVAYNSDSAIKKSFYWYNISYDTFLIAQWLLQYTSWFKHGFTENWHPCCVAKKGKVWDNSPDKECRNYREYVQTWHTREGAGWSMGIDSGTEIKSQLLPLGSVHTQWLHWNFCCHVADTLFVYTGKCPWLTNFAGAHLWQTSMYERPWGLYIGFCQ